MFVLHSVQQLSALSYEQESGSKLTFSYRYVETYTIYHSLRAASSILAVGCVWIDDRIIHGLFRHSLKIHLTPRLVKPTKVHNTNRLLCDSELGVVPLIPGVFRVQELKRVPIGTRVVCQKIQVVKSCFTTITRFINCELIRPRLLIRFL